MNRDLETKEYRFNEKEHLHELLVDGEWKALTGCTTILSVLAKPALIPWAAKVAVEFIETAHKSGLELTEQVFRDAKNAHRTKKEKAGDIGTQIHAEIESLIKEAILSPTRQIQGNKDVSELTQHFVKWAIDNNVKFLESEKHVYSKKMFLGGIVDIVCELDGKLWIADIKTGSGIYPEHFAQMAGYELMMGEMGYPEMGGAVVLNLRKDGKFEEKRSISNEDAKKFFLACVDVYRLQEKFKNQII